MTLSRQENDDLFTSDSHVDSIYIPESDVSYRPSNESIEQFNVDKHYDLRFFSSENNIMYMISKLIIINIKNLYHNLQDLVQVAMCSKTLSQCSNCFVMVIFLC